MIQNLLYLHGQDDYRLRQQVRFYRQAFLQKYKQGQLEYVDENTSWETFLGNVLTPSLFGEKRLFICDGFWDTEKFDQARDTGFFDQLETVQDLSTVIILDGKPDKRLKSTKYFLDQAKREVFEPLDTHQTIQWLSKYAEKKNYRVTQRVLSVLVNRCGENLWTLTKELDKLMATADDAEIDEQMVQTLTLPHPSLQVWDFLSALSSQNTSKALKLLEALLQSGESVYQVLAMIMREIRIHTQLRAGLDAGMGESALAKATSLHPFVVKKTLPLTRSFSKQQLEKSYDHLFELDRQIKTGGFSMTTDDTQELALALDQFIITMASNK